MEESLDEIVGPAVREAQLREGVQGVALLRRTPPVSSSDLRDADAPVRGRRGLRLELAVVRGPEPSVQNLIPHCGERAVSARVSDVGERRENPVGTLPLGVWVPNGLHAPL